VSTKNNPIRMCISCRGRFEKDTLLRLQCKDKILTTFNGIGRSFYLCCECSKDIKQTLKAIYKQCKNKADYEVQLKEIMKIWKIK